MNRNTFTPAAPSYVSQLRDAIHRANEANADIARLKERGFSLRRAQLDRNEWRNNVNDDRIAGILGRSMLDIFIPMRSTGFRELSYDVRASEIFESIPGTPYAAQVSHFTFSTLEPSSNCPAWRLFARIGFVSGDFRDGFASLNVVDSPSDVLSVAVINPVPEVREMVANEVIEKTFDVSSRNIVLDDRRVVTVSIVRGVAENAGKIQDIGHATLFDGDNEVIADHVAPVAINRSK